MEYKGPDTETRPGTLQADAKPKPPVSDKNEAVLHLDPDEEAEIRQHAAQLQQINGETDAPAPPPIHPIAQRLQNKHGIQLEDDIMKKRFQKVIESRVRGVRNALETKDVLTRPRKIGGLELPEEQVKKIIKDIDTSQSTAAGQSDESSRVAPAAPETTESSAATGTEPVYPAPPPAFVPRPGQEVPQQPHEKKDASEHTAVEQAKTSAAPPQLTPSTGPEHTVQPAPAPTAPEADKPPSPEPVAEKPKIFEQPPETTASLYGAAEAAMPRRAPIAVSEPERPQVVDIKQPQRTIGPVEELAEIDLKEFRRMGGSPEESAERVMEKIDLLQEESWKMRTDGIHAWKHSPVFQLYIDIGQESINSGVPIAEIIRKRQQEKHPVLLEDEFMAINQLNKQFTI